MPVVSFSPGGYHYTGEVAYDVQAIKGDGGAAYPVLTIPIELSVKPVVTRPGGAVAESRRGIRPITILQVNGVLRLGDGTRVAEMATQAPAHPSLDVETGNKRTLYLDFPLDTHRLLVIEGKRHGKSVGFRLSLDFLAVIAAAMPPPSGENPGYGIEFGAANTTVEFTIPQSQWAGEILPRLGYGETVLMELPLPAPGRREALEGAVQHLNRAWAAFREGNDPEVLRVCYLLWERLVKDFGVGDKPDQNAWSLLLDKVAVEPAKRDILRHLCDYLARFDHLARHEHEPPVPVAHRDAEFALLATQTVLVYLAKLLA